MIRGVSTFPIRDSANSVAALTRSISEFECDDKTTDAFMSLHAFSSAVFSLS